MIISQKIALEPTKRQEKELRKHAAARRWAWNWGLEIREKAWKERKAQLDSGMDKKDCVKVPTAFTLSNRLTPAISLSEEKGGTWWGRGEINRYAATQAFRDLDKAFDRYFDALKKWKQEGCQGEPEVEHPKPHHYKKGRGGFRLYGVIRVTEKAVKVPNIGWIRIKPGQHGYITAWYVEAN